MLIKKLVVTFLCIFMMLACDGIKQIDESKYDTIDLNYSLRIQRDSVAKQAAILHVPLPMEGGHDQILVEHALSGTMKIKPKHIKKNRELSTLLYDLGDVDTGFVRVINVKTKITINKHSFTNESDGTTKSRVELLQKNLDFFKEKENLGCLKKAFALAESPELSDVNTEIFVGVRKAKESQLSCWLTLADDESRIILDPELFSVVSGDGVTSYIAFAPVSDLKDRDLSIKDMLISARAVSTTLTISN